MAHIVRVGSKAPARMVLGRKSLLSAGAVAAAGLAALTHKSAAGGLLSTRHWITSPWAAVPSYYSRSQATLASFFPSISADMAALTPPQPPPVWTHTPEEVLRLTEERIAKHKEALDKIAALPEAECTFDTVCSQLVSIHILRVLIWTT
jgi:hypothetical protein